MMKTPLDSNFFKYAQQIIIGKDSIISHGNGFFLKYRENYFLISANHVVHIPGRNDVTCYLLTHMNGNTFFSTNVLPINTIGNYTIIDFIEESNLKCFTFPDKHIYDVAFIKDDWIGKQMDFQVAFEQDTDKDKLHFYAIDSSKIETDIDKTATYYVVGRLLSHIKGLKWTYEECMRPIKYEGRALYENISFVYDSAVLPMSIWEGLSGSPVFSSEGHLAGMLIEKNPDEPFLTVVPISQILKIIDIMYYEENISLKE